MPAPDRLFLGGVRNLLAGVTAVAHHNAFHRSLARDDFPVHVIERYQFAHSPGLTPELKRTYRSSDRRIPWMVHAAEGTDERCRGEVLALARLNLLRENTVVVHGIGLSDADRAALAEVNASVVWCPESNRNLYGVTADVRALQAAGVRVGLGSDSPVSGVRDALSNLAAARCQGGRGDGRAPRARDAGSRGGGAPAGGRHRCRATARTCWRSPRSRRSSRGSAVRWSWWCAGDARCTRRRRSRTGCCPRGTC